MINWLKKMSLSWPKRIRRSGTFFMITTVGIFYVTSLAMSGVFLLLRKLIGWEDIQSEHPFAFFVVLCLVSSIVGNVVAYLVGNPSIRNLISLTEAAKKIKNGNFAERAEAERRSILYNFTVNFNSMAEELEGIETIRSDFINGFSHEIKTPIVSIRGFAQELKNTDISEEDRQMYLDVIISESDRLSKMATNVLNLSRVEQQNILSDTAEFNMGEQLRRALVLLMDRFDAKDIDLDVDIDDVKYVGNENLLEQVWINLIDNALKFTPEKGVIKVSLKNDEKAIKATVCDNGCGIEKEELPFIFDKFYQAKDGAKALGNGLGLTLVKKIVSLHGGEIGAQSNPGEGTTISIVFPQNEEI